MVKIKICGITNKEDAEKAVSLGADAVGFVFAASPRKVAPETAGDIIKRVKGRVLSVGVFVNESPEEVRRIADYCSLDALQFHGDETPEYCARFKGIYVIKAFRVKDDAALDSARGYKGVSAYLLDTFSEKEYGGTGKAFDWNIAVKIKSLGRPVILSGGLGPDNVARAIKIVSPYGVDISSSVESSAGKKDHNLMEKAIRAARAADHSRP